MRSAFRSAINCKDTSHYFVSLVNEIAGIKHLTRQELVESERVYIDPFALG